MYESPQNSAPPLKAIRIQFFIWCIHIAADRVMALEEVSLGQEELHQAGPANKDTSGALMTHSTLASRFQRRQFRDRRAYWCRGDRSDPSTHHDCPITNKNQDSLAPDPKRPINYDEIKSKWESKENIKPSHYFQ